MLRELIEKLADTRDEEIVTEENPGTSRYKKIIAVIAMAVICLIVYNVLSVDTPTKMIRHLTDIELKYIHTGVLDKEDAQWVVDNWTDVATGRSSVREMFRGIRLIRRMAEQGIEVKADIKEIQDTLYSVDGNKASAAVTVRVEMKGNGVDFATDSRILMELVKVNNQWKLYRAMPI